jgi:BirA family biotin operon repressor/biotin-[acetyl-CoA-carboxylase] ligase
LTDIPASLSKSGADHFPGFSLRVVSRTGSTQDVARREAVRGCDEGFCVVALEQDSGRGRQGRAWVAAPGDALLTSLVVHCPTDRLTALPLATGLAVAEAIAGLGGDVCIKWPNDVLHSRRKVAGILVEAVPGGGTAVVGIGVNLAATHLPADLPAAGLDEVLGRQISWQEMLQQLLPRLATRWRQACEEGVPGFRTDWLGRATGVGETVIAQRAGDAIQGRMTGIDDDGALLLEVLDRGVVRLLAADVHLGVAGS